jgi:flagellar hook assembly protein FlgD
MYKLDLTTLVGVGNKTADIKSAVQLNCFPNPFRDETNITFELSQKENVLLKVYDLQGRKVAGLLNKTMPAGKHAVKWNGSNDAGINVANGSYILKIETGNKSETRKVILER